jgi:hypothetical protein
MDDSNPDDVPRPRDLALLLLASGDLLPRKRARTQQADSAGLDLKRQVLESITAIDPDPADLEATLMQIVQELGPPAGPVRALAILFREEWQAACVTPAWMAHLLAEAIAAPHPRRKDQPRG